MQAVVQVSYGVHSGPLGVGLRGCPAPGRQFAGRLWGWAAPACCPVSTLRSGLYAHQDSPPAGIVYGLYLTLSTWILYYVATRMSFFEDSCHLPSLNTQARLPYRTLFATFEGGRQAVRGSCSETPAHAGAVLYRAVYRSCATPGASTCEPDLQLMSRLGMHFWLM